MVEELGNGFVAAGSAIEDSLGRHRPNLSTLVVEPWHALPSLPTSRETPMIRELPNPEGANGVRDVVDQPETEPPAAERSEPKASVVKRPVGAPRRSSPPTPS